MSRNLPPRPNLEHLKKQAKDLLRALQQENPQLKLADAPHALAREYGFASWPKLKAYVASQAKNVSSVEEALKGANPFVGNWTANLSKSKRHPSNHFQSATLEFQVDGDEVVILDMVVDESGHENHGKNTILVDGQEHASDNGYVMVARWRGPRILETEAKKDGLLAGWGTYEVAQDGKCLTVARECHSF